MFAIPRRKVLPLGWVFLFCVFRRLLTLSCRQLDFFPPLVALMTFNAKKPLNWRTLLDKGQTFPWEKHSHYWSQQLKTATTSTTECLNIVCALFFWRRFNLDLVYVGNIQILRVTLTGAVHKILYRNLIEQISWVRLDLLLPLFYIRIPISHYGDSKESSQHEHHHTKIKQELTLINVNQNFIKIPTAIKF